MHRTTRIAVPLLAAALALPAAATADTIPLLPLADGDLAATELEPAPGKVAGPAVSHDPVAFSWPIERTAALVERPAPATATSREYWLRVTAAELAEGVALPTTAPAALVRLNPAGDAAAERAPDPGDLALEAPDGSVWRDGEGMELLADADAVKASGAPFAEGTVAFRLRGDLGAGRFVLRAPGLAALAATPFVVHVLEPSSPYALQLTADRTDALAGAEVHAVARLAASRSLPPGSIEATLIAPSGRRLPATVRTLWNGDARLTARVESAGGASRGLWQLEASVATTVGDLEVRRQVRTAFSATTPTARLGEAAAVEQREDGTLAVRLPVQAAAEGRYEVRAVLFGTRPDGVMVPAAVGHSADWLPAGNTALELLFGTDLTEGLGAPYELRDLQLVDQSRMGLLHRQARGLLVD